MRSISFEEATAVGGGMIGAPTGPNGIPLLAAGDTGNARPWTNDSGSGACDRGGNCFVTYGTDTYSTEGLENLGFHSRDVFDDGTTLTTTGGVVPFPGDYDIYQGCDMYRMLDSRSPCSEMVRSWII